MGLFSKDIKTMDELFIHVLRDIYYAEKQILKALPDMIEKAQNRELTAAFTHPIWPRRRCRQYLRRLKYYCVKSLNDFLILKGKWCRLGDSNT